MSDLAQCAGDSQLLHATHKQICCLYQTAHMPSATAEGGRQTPQGGLKPLPAVSERVEQTFLRRYACMSGLMVAPSVLSMYCPGSSSNSMCALRDVCL